MTRDDTLADLDQVLASLRRVIVRALDGPAPAVAPRPLAPAPPVDGTPVRNVRATAAAASDPARMTTHNGVTVDTTPGAERLVFRGRETELGRQPAALAVLLSRAMPAPVDRDFLIRNLAIGGADVSKQQRLSMVTGDLRAAAATIGLAVTSTYGVGIALAPAGE